MPDVIDADVDDDGEIDVERFTLPDASEIADPYLRKVTDEVRRMFPGGTYEQEAE